MSMPWHKIETPTPHHRKKQKRERSRCLDGKSKFFRRDTHEFNAKKEYEEFVADMSTLQEDVLGATSGKLSTFMHESFHASDLREYIIEDEEEIIK